MPVVQGARARHADGMEKPRTGPLSPVAVPGLTEARPPIPEGDRWKLVRIYPGLLEAEMAQQVLRSAGLQTQLRNAMNAGLGGALSGDSKVYLDVLTPQFEDAIELLEQLDHPPPSATNVVFLTPRTYASSVGAAIAAWFVSALALGGTAYVGFSLVLPVVAFAAHRLLARELCSNPTCMRPLDKDATTCAACGGHVAGRLRSRKHRLAAEEAFAEGRPLEAKYGTLSLPPAQTPENPAAQL